MNIDMLLQAALDEDIGWGDVTTDNCVPADKTSDGRYIAKEDMVICGLDILVRVFALIDNSVNVSLKVQDGDVVKKGEIIAEISGKARSILKGERVSLNFIQHLTGIATQTRKYADAVQDYKARITDTRKTTPGLRVLEKYAVRCGGGANHRMGLSDGVLIKDNHIAASVGITNAVNAARKGIPHTLKIEVETSDMQEVMEAVEARADIIMLDNMTLAQMTEAVQFINGKALAEASGNMGDKSLEEIRAIAACGVDIISFGGLTHSVKAADISLKFS